ncbi:uncharacterized protein BCR38DRAFT_399218 [Pseudomassariella vexata]|uniref:DUF5672 domain-containing protein n=1 Tax=Pseudomassariella vexata TaxID=1141098 RepID=A0A1Y2DIL8_9PEZI|nr:uncharacterized protein BCR38DRAFT_399218 [Pseudomassariella vexata]ORY59077.1 hypothetical protein BCR38DRAFT_399218 [Pseudomassariella vexata]
MLHFHSVLGPEWPIIFYTTPNTSSALSTSAPFARAINENRFEVRFLPPEAVFDSHRAVSLFLADTWLWEDLAPFQKLLLFQADSIICSASEATVDDYIEYDLIGAPIDPVYGQGFNGGLSIRNREMVLDLFKSYSYANDSAAPDAPTAYKFEDQWLYSRMLDLPDREDGSPGAKLPDEETARRFSVETLWEDRPLGFHQPVRWQKARMDKVVKYCPEVGMISGSAFF